jgi:hypothetical protein
MRCSKPNACDRRSRHDGNHFQAPHTSDPSILLSVQGAIVTRPYYDRYVRRSVSAQVTSGGDATQLEPRTVSSATISRGNGGLRQSWPRPAADRTYYLSD